MTRRRKSAVWSRECASTMTGKAFLPEGWQLGQCDGKITVLHWKSRLIPEALQEDYLYVIQQYLFCRLLFTASLEGESLREISKKPFIKLEK